MNKQPKPVGRTPDSLLGGLSPQQFLSRHWQKKPLLIRQAISGFQGAASIPTLLELACDDRDYSYLPRRIRSR
jgi:50S ribosomal protein L16 3-hydroxylase